MFENLDIFRMSSAMASHASRRHAIAAENMANSDTPGFKAMRVSAFADLVDGGTGFGMRATRAGHMHGTSAHLENAPIKLETDGPSPNGNTVSVESEMLEAVAARREHDRALTIYKSALKILHSTLARS